MININNLIFKLSGCLQECFATAVRAAAVQHDAAPAGHTVHGAAEAGDPGRADVRCQIHRESDIVARGQQRGGVRFQPELRVPGGRGGRVADAGAAPSLALPEQRRPAQVDRQHFLQLAAFQHTPDAQQEQQRGEDERAAVHGCQQTAHDGGKVRGHPTVNLAVACFSLGLRFLAKKRLPPLCRLISLRD